jgi:hypothetical protein
MSGEDAPRPYLENLIVPEIKTNKQTNKIGSYKQSWIPNKPLQRYCILTFLRPRAFYFTYSTNKQTYVV